jgi:two-component system, NtrC family, sensor histidine kinase HydH
MRHLLVGRYSWPFVALGGLVAFACMTSTWYINRLQDDLARAIRHDAVQIDAADTLQVQLRHLRVHTLVLVADRSEARWQVVRGDLARVDAALAAIRQQDTTPEDSPLIERIERDYAAYRDRLGLNNLPPPGGSAADLARWSDEHHMEDLLVPCRELADRQHERMAVSLERSRTQTTWAGAVLLALGLVGAGGGVLAGYATARAVVQRVARLSVRVQAVQAQLDQEVGALTVVAPTHFGDLDAQLERVVGRVKEVCERVQEQERHLHRAEHLAAVGRLAAGVAHEVRNPLTGIKVLVEAALEPGNPSPLSAEDLRMIGHEIVRMERTVQELLDYARTPPPDRRAHDVRAIVAEAVALIRSRAELKRVSTPTELPDVPLPAAVDRDQFLSLLTNLLLNALDASEPGGTIGVRAAEADGRLVVEVTDTGRGIDPAMAGRLFTPFATSKPTGTGLGLTVARRIAQDHGGTLVAANRPEGGARFTLTIPDGNHDTRT